MIEIHIPAIPVAQPRQRHRIIESGGRQFTQNYTPANSPVNQYKAAVQHAWHQAADMAPPAEGPLKVDVLFVLPRPKSRTRKHNRDQRLPHCSKPDVDNLVKSTLDALAGIAFRDDRQVAYLSAGKEWATVSEPPHVVLRLEEL